MLSPRAASPALSRLLLLSRFPCGAFQGSCLANRRDESTEAPERSSRSTTSSSSSSSSSNEATQPSSQPPPPPPRPRHWLDQRAPGAAKWLDEKNRELWFRGLQERCGRQFPLELGGHEELLLRVVEEKAESLMRRQRHGGGEEVTTTTTTTTTSTSTSRERTHLQTAALVRATGDALLPFFRGDEATVKGILLDSTGGRVAAPLRALLRLQATLSSALSRLFPSSFLSSSSFSSSSSSPGAAGVAERRLALLRNDYGGAWPGAEIVVEVEGGGRGRGKGEKSDDDENSAAANDAKRRRRTTTTTLRVPSCLYHDVMRDEGSSSSSTEPRWLDACCCSVDAVWFEPWALSNEKTHDADAAAGDDAANLPSVSFRRRRWLGAGDGACELCVTRVEAVR